MFKFLKDRFLGKLLQGQKRSSVWPRIRKEHLAEHPICACCGGKEKLEVHHEKPFHLFSELELDMENLKTLCEKRNCHFAMGHLYSWKSYNPDIEKNIEIWRDKVRNRP